MPALDGLIPLKGGQAAVLRLAKAENDPVARARSRYRLIWDAVRANPDLAVQVGSRRYILAKDSHVRALAVALGVIESPAGQRKPSLAKRQAQPSNEGAAA